jgi:hypothetical protein
MENLKTLIDVFKIELIKYKKLLEIEPNNFSHQLTINSLENVIIDLAIKQKYERKENI